MSEILLRIDGTAVKATEGMSILQAAQKAGIDIPSLIRLIQDRKRKITPPITGFS